MSATLASFIGLGAGLVLGLVDYVVLGRAADAAGRGGARTIAKIVRLMQLIFFPVAGWFVGPLVASNIAG
ncbi:hypothetical protein [Aureimonas sp. AU12]|uniref:hypothetical protein n=1 Tax=Aureimonas sp. AU12 TaxID=1638161 RepID=UPI0007846116|nr:hypothetical protein [Aureimonas sp. AU12]